MLRRLREHWKEFRKGTPGRRFQDRYERNREERESKPWYKRALKPILGIVLFLAGIVLCVIPGPGVPLIAIAGGLLADEALWIAKGMDWIEVQLTRLVKWLIARWRQISPAAKYALILLAVVVVAGMAYGGFRVISSR